MNAAEEIIKQYLDERASKDAIFAEKYNSKVESDKDSISKCLAYIENEVKNLKRTIMTDAEVFGLAMHFYDEGIKWENKHIAEVKVSKPELTEEEILAIQHKAEEDEKNRIANEKAKALREAQEKIAKQKAKAKQKALEQAKKEAESQLSLF